MQEVRWNDENALRGPTGEALTRLRYVAERHSQLQAAHTQSSITLSSFGQDSIRADGAMVCWSVGVLGKDFCCWPHHSITPPLKHSVFRPSSRLFYQLFHLRQRADVALFDGEFLGPFQGRPGGGFVAEVQLAAGQ